MKTVILTLVVLLVAFHQSDALKCFCGGQKICSDRIETCTGANNVCASILITAGSRPTYSQGCMTERDCARLNYPGISSCHSCGFDLCNR